MADTPDEAATTTSPKRARKPRVAKASATSANENASAETPAKAPRTRRTAVAKSGGSASTARKPSTRKPRATATTTKVKRAVRVVEDKATAATEGVTRKRVAIGAAAIAGVAAGVAAVIGRKKIAKATTDAIDAVTGATEAKPDLPQRSAD